MGFPRQEYCSGLPFPSTGGSSQPRECRIFCIGRQGSPHIWYTHTKLSLLDQEGNARACNSVKLSWHNPDRTQAHICVHVYFVCVHTCMCVHAWLCGHICFVCVHTPVCVYMCVYVHTHKYVCVRTSCSCIDRKNSPIWIVWAASKTAGKVESVFDFYLCISLKYN